MLLQQHYLRRACQLRHLLGLGRCRLLLPSALREDEEIGRALQDALGGSDECSYDEYYYASPVSEVSKETDSEEEEE